MRERHIVAQKAERRRPRRDTESARPKINLPLALMSRGTGTQNAGREAEEDPEGLKNILSRFRLQVLN